MCEMVKWQADGLAMGTLDNDGHPSGMTSWSAHGKVCPSQLTDGANLHHTATMEQTMEHTAMVHTVEHTGEHRCRQSRVGEMDEDNLRMREEVSTPLVHFRTHSHAHQQVCEKLKGL